MPISVFAYSSICCARNLVRTIRDDIGRRLRRSPLDGTGRRPHLLSVSFDGNSWWALAMAGHSNEAVTERSIWYVKWSTLSRPIVSNL